VAAAVILVAVLALVGEGLGPRLYTDAADVDVLTTVLAESVEENRHLGLVVLDGERKDTLSFPHGAVQIYPNKKKGFSFFFSLPFFCFFYEEYTLQRYE
jgi:hypothetical protein